MIPYAGDILLQSENMTFGMTETGTYAIYKQDEAVADALLVYQITSDPLYTPYAYFSQETSI